MKVSGLNWWHAHLARGFHAPDASATLQTELLGSAKTGTQVSAFQK